MRLPFIVSGAIHAQPQRILRERRGSFGEHVDRPLYRLRVREMDTVPANTRGAAVTVKARMPANMLYSEMFLFMAALGASLLDANLHSRLCWLGAT